MRWPSPPPHKARTHDSESQQATSIYHNLPSRRGSSSPRCDVILLHLAGQLVASAARWMLKMWARSVVRMDVCGHCAYTRMAQRHMQLARANLGAQCCSGSLTPLRHVCENAPRGARVLDRPRRRLQLSCFRACRFIHHCKSYSALQAGIALDST